MDKIDFVCEVPMDDAGMSDALPPVALPPLLTSMTDTFTAPSQPNIVVSNLVPPDNPAPPLVANPIYPPVYFPGPPTIFSGNAPPPIASHARTGKPVADDDCTCTDVSVDLSQESQSAGLAHRRFLLTFPIMGKQEGLPMAALLVL